MSVLPSFVEMSVDPVLWEAMDLILGKGIDAHPTAVTAFSLSVFTAKVDLSDPQRRRWSSSRFVLLIWDSDSL